MLSLNERLLWLLVVAAVVTLIVWLNMQKLLAPAFVLTLISLSVHREWRRRHRRPHDPMSH